MFIAGAETLRYKDIIEVIDAAKGGRRKSRHRYRRHAASRGRTERQLASFTSTENWIKGAAAAVGRPLLS